MELLRISESKIKVTLDPAEVKKYKLEDRQMGERTEVRLALSRIFKDAKESFDITKERVLVQAYPVRDGGLELFVTRLGNLSGRAESQTKSQATQLISPEQSLWRFENEGELLFALRFCKKGSKSEIYRTEDGKYILFLTEPHTKRKISPLTEFALSLPLSALDYLIEHAERVSLSSS